MNDREIRDKLTALGYLAPNQVFLECYADKGSAVFGLVGLITQIRNLISSISKQCYLAICEKSLFVINKKFGLLNEYPFSKIIEIEQNGTVEKSVTLTTAEGVCSFRTIAKSRIFTERLKAAVKHSRDLRG